jgi:NAD(P)-dependent dehydrogenase (short-subunit alcohol dehydrogenase family)
MQLQSTAHGDKHMKNVCVITGGGSGMGLATAKVMAGTHTVVICGRNQNKLKGAAESLGSEGGDVHFAVCDVADYDAVRKCAEVASRLGPVSTVINAAGVSPQEQNSEYILRINALGSVHVHNAFHPLIVRGGCLIDVGSVAGYTAPRLLLPTSTYKYASVNPEKFISSALARTRWFPDNIRPGIAYSISKNFLLWFVRAEARRFADRGARVLSVSPGSFNTEMGRRAKATADELTKFCAIQRYGNVDEIAHLLAMCADPRLGYLTGVDILCDGGCLAGCMNDRTGYWKSMFKMSRFHAEQAC